MDGHGIGRGIATGAGAGGGAGGGVGTGGGDAPGVSLSFDEIKRYLGSEGAQEGVPAKLNGKTEVRQNRQPSPLP